MKNLVQELFNGYSNNLITDRELGDMLDLATNEYTTVIDDGSDLDWESDMVDSEMSQFSYDLEASQFDYI